MTVLNRLERALCSLYVAITYPIVSLGNAWMERIERMERPERARPRDTMIASPDGTVQRYPADSAQLDMLDKHQREPTVADIQPRGSVRVHAMDARGQWEELTDYPVRLLPKVPGIEIKGGNEE